ncbi:MAG: hypothetical protein ABSB80_12055 [Methanoregula sp.]|jgi:hypothetical protein|uniref:hypothetical protein n=1 Tax=Methanoregula sp. TaxID=2052170 RepID=UPI003D0BD870
MPDFTIFEDRTIKHLIVGIIGGLTLGMVLDIVLVVFKGSAYVPVVFFLSSHCGPRGAGVVGKGVGVRGVTI